MRNPAKALRSRAPNLPRRLTQQRETLKARQAQRLAALIEKMKQEKKG